MSRHPRLVLHLDVDAFAAAVERRLDPTLQGRPLFIGPAAGGRGIVQCASYEARALGVRPGMPVAAARRRVPDALWLAGQPAEYRRHGARLHAWLRARAPIVECAGPDDFYLDLTGCGSLFGGGAPWARRLAREAAADLGLPLSLGLAASKLMACLLARLAKPGRLFEVFPGCEAELMAPVPLALLPGIPPPAAARLREAGVRCAGQMSALGEETLRLLFGWDLGGRLIHLARGECTEPVTDSPAPGTEAGSLTVMTEVHTFPEDTTDPAAIAGAAVLIAHRTAWRLRRAGLQCTRAEVRLYHTGGGTGAASAAFPAPADADACLARAFGDAARRALRRRTRVRSVEVRVLACADADSGQGDLFCERERVRQAKLLRAVDLVRERHGLRALTAGPVLALRRGTHSR